MSQLDDLVAQAEDFEQQERSLDAAMAYERARSLARDQGDLVLEHRLTVKAAKLWSFGGEEERGLQMVLEALTAGEGAIATTDLYHARAFQFHLLVQALPTSLAGVRDVQGAADVLYGQLVDDGPDSNYRAGLVASWRGLWDSAYEDYQAAYAKQSLDGLSIDECVFAAAAALSALRTGRVEEARRWCSRVESTYWPVMAAVKKNWIELHTALWDGNHPEALAQLAAGDELLEGPQRLRWSSETTSLAVQVLCLDEAFGDPLEPGHPSSRRLDDFPPEDLRNPYGRQLKARMVLAHRLAGLRWAAGEEPDEDYFGRPPRSVPVRPEPRLPTEISARAAAARAACDEAMAVAEEIDRLAESTWRRDEVTNLHRRIDEIVRRQAAA